MPSPFPGMNPNLERPSHWNDFHLTVIPVMRELLLPQIRPAYYIRLDEHLYIHEPNGNGDSLIGRGDLNVSRSGKKNASSSTAAVIEAPVRGRVPVPDFERQPYLEIRDRENDQVITVIELLSPSNKSPGKDRDHYLAKRDEVLWSGAHLIEIDLLRAGRRPPIEGLPQCAYYIMVSRAEPRPEVGLWPINLRDPLPRIPVPLQDPHPAAHLDVQMALNHAYDSGGYEFIYRNPPESPLASDDAAWAAQFVPARA